MYITYIYIYIYCCNLKQIRCQAYTANLFSTYKENKCFVYKFCKINIELFEVHSCIFVLSSSEDSIFLLSVSRVGCVAIYLGLKTI